MFRSLVNWFRAENLLVQAKKKVLEMLKIVDELFDDSVNLFWAGKGVSLDELRKRDKKINHLVRDVRKKVLTHLAFTGTSDLEMSLVMVNIVVFIERIGDYTKDIGYLSTEHPGTVNAAGMEDKVRAFEKDLGARLKTLVDIFSNGDEVGTSAMQLANTHKEMNTRYDELAHELLDPANNKLSPADSARLALYLRYLRRIEGHVFNIASAEVNPFHRISFKVKKVSG